MNILAIATVSLFLLGLFTLVIPSTLAQPCENNGHAVLGTGKQLLKQLNRCIIIENNNPSSGICGPNSVLQNGVCVPTTTGTCPTNTILQNGVCVPISSTCPPGSILQNGICVPFTNPVQSPPIANAGQSQTVTDGVTVSLDGSGSFATTSGATITSYSWVQTSGPTVGLNGATTATPFFTAPSSPATLTFSLTVTDSLGQVSAPSSVTVTVTPS